MPITDQQRDARRSLPQLHYSAIETMERCGELFRRRYVEKEIIPPGVALVAGTATHKAVATNLTEKMRTGAMLPAQAVADVAHHAVDAAWDAPEGVTLTDDEREAGAEKVRAAATQRAVRLSVLHRNAAAPAIDATHIERGFVLELPGYPVNLAGTIDIVERFSRFGPTGSGFRALGVRDTKMASKSPTGTAALESDQLTMYALGVRTLDGDLPARLALDYLVDLKRGPQLVTLETQRTEADLAPLLRRVETVVNAIEKGVFVPARESDWWCSRKWCGYWHTCPYVRRPVSLTVNGTKESDNGNGD